MYPAVDGRSAVAAARWVITEHEVGIVLTAGWPLAPGRRRQGFAWVRTPALLKTAGDDPPEIWTFQLVPTYLFLETYFLAFSLSHIFKIKWPKSKEKLNFGGRWVWVTTNPFPNQNFMATPLEGERENKDLLPRY